MTPISLQGIWWSPESPNHREKGTLNFDQVGGGRLEIIGGLVPLDSGPLVGGEELDVIHGFTTTGKCVTLLNTSILNSRWCVPGIPTETWRVTIIAIGAHFMKSNETLFSRSWLRFDGISLWLGNDPFAETYDFSSNTTALTVRKPPQIDLGRIEGAAVYTGSHVSSGREGHERWTSISEAMIAIDADDPQSLDWHFSKSAKLRALAEMLFGRPLHLTKLLVELPGEPSGVGYPPYVDIEIYAQMTGGDDKLPPVDRPPMLTAPALLAAAPSALADWFKQYETLSSALYLLSTVASDRRMFLSVRFLLAAQAIETFHRETCPGKIIPEKDHDKIVHALMNALPLDTSKPMREKLSSLLEHSNEPSLRQRLRSVIVMARDGRRGMMPAYDRDFINAVVATRNHLTHHGDRPRNLLEGMEMYWAIRRIVVLLTVLFLRRLGLQSDAIDMVLTRHREFHTIWTTATTP